MSSSWTPEVWRDMISTEKREFQGLLDVYKKTWQSDGIVGLYRGFSISFVGFFIYRYATDERHKNLQSILTDLSAVIGAFTFGLYDTIMPMFPESNIAVRFGVGYVVTVLGNCRKGGAACLQLTCCVGWPCFLSY